MVEDAAAYGIAVRTGSTRRLGSIATTSGRRQPARAALIRRTRGIPALTVQENDRVRRRPYLSVILPAYNEAGSIRRTLGAVRTFLDDQGYHYQVIVAADGDDATPDIVREMAREWPNLHLSAERGRHGKGHGLRRGMALTCGEIVGFLDADYKTPVDELTKLLPWLHEGYDLVIGSRALPDSRVEVRQPRYRQVGSRLFALGMHGIIGLHDIRDTQCGFKFFTRQAGLEIFGRTRIDGYMCDVEILWLARRLGFRVKEVGIRWRDDGDSRLQLVQGNLRNVLDLLRVRLHRY
jgi:dolichyl-phosphate beta-glucosyltransferase